MTIGDRVSTTPYLYHPAPPSLTTHKTNQSELLLLYLLVLVVSHCYAALVLIECFVLYCCGLTWWWVWLGLRLRRGLGFIFGLILTEIIRDFLFLNFLIELIKELLFLIGLLLNLEANSALVGLFAILLHHLVLR
jgi:hypothetical protein